MDIGIIIGLIGVVLTVVFGVPVFLKKEKLEFQITTEHYETLAEKLKPVIKEILNDKTLSDDAKKEKIKSIRVTATRINELCEIAAELYEKGIRNKIKLNNLENNKLGRDLITTVKIHESQSSGKVNMGIPKDDDGSTISLQAWLAIFTNYPPEWWIGIFQEIANEATKEFQIWAVTHMEPELQDFCKIDERGRLYRSVDIASHRNGYRYDLVNPFSKDKIECPVRGWKYNESEMYQKIDEGHVQYIGNRLEGRVLLKDYLNEIVGKE